MMRFSNTGASTGSPPVAAQHQVRKEHGPRNTRLRSSLYIDNAQGAPRRDEQNPPAVSTSGLSLLPLPSVA